MALWQKLKSLDSNSTAVKEILRTYSSKNIPIELRDLCAVWIEGSIHQSTPEKFCTGLRNQIQNKLQNSQTTQMPFYVIGKLLEFQTRLNTCSAPELHKIYQQFQECLKSDEQYANWSDNPDSSVSSPATSDTSLNSNPYSFPSRSRGASLDGSCSISSFGASSISEFYQNLNEPTESFEPDTFMNHPTKINMDRELDVITNAVAFLEEANNSLSFKCHEMKRLQDILGQLTNVPNGNGTQVQIHTQILELQTKIQEIRSEVTQVAPQIAQRMLDAQNYSTTLVQHWIQLKTELDSDLSDWATQQKLNANGKQMRISIRRLQIVAEYLMDVAWKLRGRLMVANNVRFQSVVNGNANIPGQIYTVTALIKRLVQDTFLVEHQPCQVLKTNTRFHILPGRNPMEVCLLVGDKLGIQLNPPSVAVCIVDEEMCRTIQAHGLEGTNFNQVIKKGKLLPEHIRLDFCQQKKCSTAAFRQISLKDFFRNSRNRSGSGSREQTELVTEEKFALLFRAEICAGDLQFQVWRLSLPIVITTHGSQESLAWAAVSWDNAFSCMNRIPFQLPDYVNWEGVAEMLNGRFTIMVGAPLTQENLSYFAERLSIYPGYPERLTWSEVCKNNLPGKRFTFWDWFYEGAKLVEQHLKEAWKDGYIKGFIGKESSEDMLCRSGCLAGTFLLRFSESTLGGLSIVWLHSNGTAYSLAPFKSKDLSAQPLVEKINQETLHYVFPSTSKEEAFRKYYEEYEISRRSDGTTGNGAERYVQTRNIVIIDHPTLPRFQAPDSQIDPQSTNTAFQIEFDVDIDELLSACGAEDVPQNTSYPDQSSIMNRSTGGNNEPAASIECMLQSDSHDGNGEQTYFRL